MDRIAALVPEFAVKDLPLGRTLMMMMITIIIFVEKFKYKAIKINREENKIRINMGNASYYSLEKILSFRLQTVRENTEILIKARKDIGLEVNSEKIKYIFISRQENIVQNRNIQYLKFIV